MLFLVCFGVFRFWVSESLQNYFMGQEVQQVRTQTERIAVEVSSYIIQHDAEGLYSYLTAEASSLGGALVVVNSKGTVLMDAYSRYNGRRLPYPELKEVLSGNSSFSWGLHTLTTGTNKVDADGTGLVAFFTNLLHKSSDNRETVIYAASTVLGDGDTVGAVVLSLSFQSVMDRISNVNLRMTLILVAVAAAAFLFNLFFSSALTRPIHSMQKSMEMIGNGDFSHRITVRGHNEIAQMAETFNSVTQKLQTLDQTRGEFVSNASHELKTPLASIKILVETLQMADCSDPAMNREFLADINSEIDRMSQLISDLLSLVKRDEGTDMMREPLSLSKIAVEVMKKLDALAAEKQIFVENGVKRDVIVEGDRMMLEQMVTNLVDNAIKYTPEGGNVRVELRKVDGMAQLLVIDTGIGIAPEDADRIFERFYRVDKARSRKTGGTGLGLPIVKGIVQVHGGSIQVHSKPGEGTTMEVLLPLAEQHEEGEESK